MTQENPGIRTFQPGSDEDGFGGDAPPLGSPPVQPTAPTETEPVEIPTDVPVEAEANDEEDVPAALERETEDGPGFDDESELPESDFDGYAEDDVEEEEK
jgi:hypothetical protein